MPSNTNTTESQYGMLIGMGIVLFLAFIGSQVIPNDLTQDSKNILGALGGMGLVTSVLFIFRIIRYGGFKLECNTAYKEFSQQEKIRKAINKEQSDEILKKYESMPDLPKEKSR